MLGTVMRDEINESADLRRQMMAMRVNRAHCKFHWTVFRQQTNEAPRRDIVGDQKSRGQSNADTLQSGRPQRLAAVGNQIARNPHRHRRAFPIDEMPFIPIRIKYMADAITICEFGQLLGRSVFFKIGRRTAQHVLPGRQAAYNQAGIGRRRQPDCKVKSLVDQIDGSLAHPQIDLDVGV